MPTAGQGTAREKSSSLTTFLSTLVPVLAIVGVISVIVLVFRKRQRRVYEPRTYVNILREHEKTPDTSSGLLTWIKDYRSLKDEYVLNHNSLDNYLFVRYFKILVVICFVGCLITWPVLFPINATGGGGQKEFDLLSFSNVLDPNRYYAHVFIAWIFLGFVMMVIARETVLFINLRQAYIMTSGHISRLSSRTVLFTNVPTQLRNESSIRETFPSVQYVWTQADCKELEELVEDRDKAAVKLEAAENKMCITLVKKHKKAEKKGKTQDIPLMDSERGQITVDKKDRPTHKLKFLIGKKVDTIDWARTEIKSLNQKVETAIQTTTKADRIGAVFVEFETLEAAQAAMRQANAEQKSVKVKDKMSPKAIGVIPQDVIWKNLGLDIKKTKSMSLVSTVIITVMVIFWAIPVSFVGAISNIQNLTDGIPFLSFILKIPAPILGVVTGLLPVVLLAALMALVPIFCRFLASRFLPTHSLVESKTQSWYFLFQVIQVFLITTFTSSAAAVANTIVQDPTQAPTLLATNLPKASNFYIAYFVLQGLNRAAMQVLNAAVLAFMLILGKFLDKTPRKMYNRYTSLIGIGWGSVYPVYTNLGVIAISYSCIAPLVMGFATVGFTCLYLAYRYQMLYVVGMKIDMRGQAYIKALRQLYVGIYLAEFCLVGLFAIGISKSATSTGPLILMIIFAAFTILFQIFVNRALDPLVEGEQMVARDQHMSAKNPSLGSAEDAEAGHMGHKARAARNEDSTTATTDGLTGKIQRFLFHSKFARHCVLNQELAPHHHDPVRPYTQEEREGAYIPPSMTDEMQTIWIARDEYGLSSQEVQGCEEFSIPASDAEASLNEKAKIVWDHNRIAEAPVYQPRVYY